MNERIYVDNYTVFDKIVRLSWRIVQAIFFNPWRGIFFNRWRLWILKLFGAKIGKGCKIAATATIWAPWNLSLGDYVCIADGVDCYSADKIILNRKSTCVFVRRVSRHHLIVPATNHSAYHH